MKQMRGVNLGGWLVLERWMTPSLFEGVGGKGEYAFSVQLGEEEARRRLQRHRDSFITKNHVRQIADMGLELLRVPVGYWLFGGAPPYIGGGDEYVDQLLAWADEYELKVILDFHAAPGSQNGHDHSGKPGEIRWHLDDNIEASLQFLRRLVERYGNHKAFVGVEVLNEPSWEIGKEILIEYYQQAEKIIKEVCPPEVAVIVSDAFRPLEMSKALRRAKLRGVVLDVHLYQLFTPEDRALDVPGHIKKTQKEWGRLIRKLRRHHDVLIGEWSAAMSELYDSALDQQRSYGVEDYRQYARVQRQVFDDGGASWTCWTARTEDGGIWSLLDHPDLVSS